MAPSPCSGWYFWFTSVQLCRIQDQGVCTGGGMCCPKPSHQCSWGQTQAGTAQGHCATSLTQLHVYLEGPWAQHPTADHQGPHVSTPSSIPTPCPAPTCPHQKDHFQKAFLYQAVPKKAALIIKVPQSHFQETLRSLALFQGIEGRINISIKCCTKKPDAFLCGPKGALRSVTKTKLETHWEWSSGRNGEQEKHIKR